MAPNGEQALAHRFEAIGDITVLVSMHTPEGLERILVPLDRALPLVEFVKAFSDVLQTLRGTDFVAARAQFGEDLLVEGYDLGLAVELPKTLRGTLEAERHPIPGRKQSCVGR